MREHPFVVDVLLADGGRIASFTCPIDAVRFAALRSEPGCEMYLRRVSDGAVRPFLPASPPGALLGWLGERATA
jgi:hypothetical protein